MIIDNLSHPRCSNLLWALAFAAIALGPSLAAAKPHWLKLEAKDFVAYSDASERNLVETAVHYAAYRQAFRTLFLPPDRTMPRTTLVLFRHQGEFEDYVVIPHESHTTISHYSVEVDGTPLLALAIAGDREEALQRTFEFETIWALQRVGYYVPVWMSQGTGEVLSTLELRKGHCIVGRSDSDREQQFDDRDYEIEWPRFFDISQSSQEYSGHNATGAFHSQAWALMHWILFKDAATRERFAALAERLRTTPGLAAVEATMHLPARKFRTAILDHLDRDRERELPFDDAAVRASFKITPAPEAEILAETSNLLAATGRIDKCNRQLDRAAQLAPDSPAVEEALARRAARENRPDDAAQLYRDAIAHGTTHASVYLKSADAHLNESAMSGMDSPGGAGNNAAVAIDEIHHALQLNPGNPEAYRLLGRAYFVAPTVTADQAAELNPGVSLGEAGERVRFYRALVYERLERTDEAIADLRQIAADPDVSETDRRRAQSRLATEILQSAYKRIEPLLNDGRFKEAHKILDAVDSNGLPPNTARQLDDLRSRVDEFAQWHQIVELYNDHHWEEFAAAAKKYLDQHPNGGRRRSLERMLAHAEQQQKPSAPPASP